jgi:hypothetical protein
MTKVIKFENGKRRATITESRFGYSIFFYYDNVLDYEWKRGAHGMACDNCDTLAKAKAKAKRYISKE